MFSPVYNLKKILNQKHLMATRRKKEVTEVTTPQLKGSEEIRNLQEKQIVVLDKVHDALSKSIDTYNSTIDEAKKKLNDIYYEIKEKEEYLDALEKSRKENLAIQLDKIQNDHDDRINQSLSDYQEKVDKLTKEISDLQKTFEIKRKDFQVNFEIDLKSSKEKTLKSLLDEYQLAYISLEDYNKMKETITNHNDLTQKEIGKVIGIESRKHQAELKETQLTYEKQQASNEAKIEQQQMQIDFLNNQVKEAKAQVQAILDNQVKVAEAGKGINIVTGDSKK